MILDGNSQTLQVALSSAIAGTNPTYWVSWTQLAAATMDNGNGQGGTLNGASTVNVLDGAANKQLKVDELAVFNSDTVPVTATVKVSAGTTTGTLYQAYLGTNWSLQYGGKGKWQVNDEYGVPVRYTVNGADVQIFTANGTWVKPVNFDAKIAHAYVVGGGGGGGGGAINNEGSVAANTRYGGSGGGGGAFNTKIFTVADLPNSVLVEVGDSGLSGGGRLTVAGNGTSGGVGGMSAFGTYVAAFGGGGGFGGSTVDNQAQSGGGGGGRGSAGTTGGQNVSVAGGGPGFTDTTSANGENSGAGGRGTAQGQGQAENGGGSGGGQVALIAASFGGWSLYGAGGGGTGGAFRNGVNSAPGVGGVSMTRGGPRVSTGMTTTSRQNFFGTPIPTGFSKGGEAGMSGNALTPGDGGSGGNVAPPTSALSNNGSDGGDGGAPGGGGAGGGASVVPFTGGNGGTGGRGEVRIYTW